MIGYRCTEDWVPGDEEDDRDEDCTSDELEANQDAVEYGEELDNARHG